MILHDRLHEIGNSVPPREVVAGRSRRGNLDPHLANLEDVADARTVLGQACHREVPTEPTWPDVVAAPFLPPARVVLRGIHEQSAIRSAMTGAVILLVARQPFASGPDLPKDRLLADGTGPGPFQGVFGARRPIGTGMSDLNGVESHL